MALINCPECNNQVSNIAVSCPHCGAPITKGSRSTVMREPFTTIQETNKKLKMQIIISSVLFWFGFIGFLSEIAQGNPPRQDVINTSTAIWGIGFIWYLLTRGRIWWHHK